MTITFRAGEIDLDFGVVMERMDEGFKRAVDEKAKALLEERLHDFQAKVYNLCDRIEDCIQDEAAKVFPDFKREDDD